MTAREGGTVVQVDSALAFCGTPVQAPYCSAKVAGSNSNEAVRVELQHKGSAGLVAAAAAALASAVVVRAAR